MNLRKLQDLKQGEQKEMILSEVIKNTFNLETLTKTEGFHPLDFIDGNNKYYEIKSRNCNHNTYPTTMIGLNKIEYIKKHNLDCTFVFAFNDGNYYYCYNCDDELTISKGGRNDRGRPEFKQYVYIPISKLNKI